MKQEAKKLLKSYWDNESKIQELARSLGSTVDEIAENPNNFSESMVSELEALLESKKSLLLKLVPFDKKDLAEQKIVDLFKYRQLSAYSSS